MVSRGKKETGGQRGGKIKGKERKKLSEIEAAASTISDCRIPSPFHGFASAGGEGGGVGGLKSILPS